MAIVPSWQQIPPQHAAIQQPLLSEAEWGRPLLVDSSAILQEQRPVFPVDVTAEVYNQAIVEHPAPGNWGAPTSKRGSKNHHVGQSGSHHNHHLMVPTHHRSHHDKKEQTQLSPVKKRVKEGTPPSEQLSYGGGGGRRNHSPGGGHWQHQQQVTQDHHTQTTNHHGHGHHHHHHHHHHGNSSGRQHTITINDTPSPAVSVITISDSEDETGEKAANRNNAAQHQVHNQQQPSGQQPRKNVISCVSVPDSDEDRSSSKVSIRLSKHCGKLKVFVYSSTSFSSKSRTSRAR